MKSLIHVLQYCLLQPEEGIRQYNVDFPQGSHIVSRPITGLNAKQAPKDKAKTVDQKR